MGVAVTIAGGGDVFFFSLFSEPFAVKEQAEGTKRPRSFFHRQLRGLYEADLHEPGIYGSGRVWANAWDVSRRAPSRGGRGRRSAVGIVVCFGRGGFFSVLFFAIFFLRTYTAYSKYEANLPHLHLY